MPNTACASSDAAARNALAKAGLTDKAIDKVFSGYRPYLRWDVDAKLTPAIQQWLQELGPTELSRRLQRYPRLLLDNPAKAKNVFLWLKSLGIDAAQMQHKEYQVFARELSALQESLSVFQQVAKFTDEQIPWLLRRHSAALEYEPRRILKSLECISRLLGVPVASNKFRNVVLTSDRRLFHRSAETIERRITWFCNTYGISSDVAGRAIKAGMYNQSTEGMQDKAMKLQTMLHWSQPQLSKRLSKFPRLLLSNANCIAINMQGLQAVGFASHQVLDMCTQQPSLLAHNWSSSINFEKVGFYKIVLGLSIDDIAADATALSRSLTKRGPGLAFFSNIMLWTRYKRFLLSAIARCTDPEFSCKYLISVSNGPAEYNDLYVQQWLPR